MPLCHFSIRKKTETMNTIIQFINFRAKFNLNAISYEIGRKQGVYACTEH